MKDILQYLAIKKHPNTICPQIRHMPVLQQHRGSQCGFHMIFNAKCMVKALIAKTQYNQVINLINLQSNRIFFQDMQRTKKILLKCRNEYYVNQQDKKELKGYDPALNRSHCHYLMMNDPELLDLQKKEDGTCPVYINMLEYSFGLVQRSVDQIIELDMQIKEFKLLKKPAIFVLFVGVVNHWVAFIVQKKGKRSLVEYQQMTYKKGKKSDNKFYLLDSSNF